MRAWVIEAIKIDPVLGLMEAKAGNFWDEYREESAPGFYAWDDLSPFYQGEMFHTVIL